MIANINTYGGMNKDMAADSMPNNLYLDAVDIRITTTQGESMGAWTNIKGNTESFTIPSSGDFNGNPWTALNPEIIGWTTIRNRIILFVADDSDTKGWIYDVQYDPASREILPSFPVLKYYNANFNFKKANPIKAIGRFETDCIQRVYWSDYNNYFRAINLEDEDLATLALGLIDIFPDITYTQPLLKTVTGGGQLTSGEYQIAYRLVTTDGKKSLISPPSNLIHIVSESETLIQSAQYTGDPTQVNTGKSITIELDTSNYGDYEKIEFFSVYHSGIASIPEVKFIEEVSIDSQNTVSFTYTGGEDSAFNIELADYTAKSFPFITAKTMTEKDGSLVLANIKGQSVSIQDLLAVGETFDAKTIRYNSLGEDQNTAESLTLTPLQLAFNEAYNKDAHWDSDWHTDKQYKYQSNGTTLGGEGPNVTYKFTLEPYTMDGSPTPGFANVANIPNGYGYDEHVLNDGYDYNNTTYPNHASPFISGLLRGFKRGETYRIGIVGYTTKGEATFVEFIGDIKFPDISDIDDTDTVIDAEFPSGIKYFPLSLTGSPSTTTVGFALGLQVTIDLSTCPTLTDKIKSFQIVRVKREESDKRRLSQGIIKTFWRNAVTSQVYDFDLRIDSNTNALHLNPYYPEPLVLPGPEQIAPAGSLNGTFRMLEDMEPYAPGTTPGGVKIFDDYYVKGQYLGFYSPEISYNFANARSLGTALSNNPCLLFTGALSTQSRTLISDQDLTANDLAESTRDYRNTLRSTYPITFHSIENIKRWDENKFVEMVDTNDYNVPVTGVFGSYAMRNYYAIDDISKSTNGSNGPGLTAGSDLNDPQLGAGGTTDNPEIYKAGTSIIGKVEKYANDPITGDPVPTASATDYFDPVDIDVLGQVTLTPETARMYDTTPIVELIIPKEEVYGGFSQNALEANIFIPCSPVLDIQDLISSDVISDVKVFGGDIFINMWTLQTGMVEFFDKFYLDSGKQYAQSNGITEVIPIESTINIDLDYGATLKRGVEYSINGIQFTVLRQETGNAVTTNGKVNYMYGYNGVNSRDNYDLSFFVKPDSLMTDCNVNDLRAYLSNVKINGEAIDSWTQFGINNYTDVDDYGPINEILNFRDSVWFFQDKAVGIYSINRDAITTTEDGVPTLLGTGAGFGKSQYYTKQHGSIHQWAIKATDTGIYFFDAIHRKIFCIADGNTPLSEIKGIHSFLQLLPSNVFKRKENEGDNPILEVGVHIAKDIINDEVIFTFMGKGPHFDLETETLYTVGQIVCTGPTTCYLVTEEFTSGETLEEARLDLATNSDPVSEAEFKNLSIVYDELMQQFSSRYSVTPKVWGYSYKY
jgi:hypothetical protein